MFHISELRRIVFTLSDYETTGGKTPKPACLIEIITQQRTISVRQFSLNTV